MDQRCFVILCHLFRTIAGLTSIEIIDVEEMVAMLLHVSEHDIKNRVIQREFLRSGETISQHFNIVLLAMLRLHDELLKKPQPVTNGCTDPRYPNAEGFLASYRGVGGQSFVESRTISYKSNVAQYWHVVYCTT
ncbi:putative nuclease HARBI1 [Cucumis melo var. makuwa]|uniref:Nuclease HARBI1 n=1 Tax=Cucumis melo var. makuwa TaxID=1194695 RepID=A0A5A7T579_CUCMM|nr:putative nuclease HARBI1 [Cucumis melo var. makuwa]TYJ95814.1 putative nuclease HARBI1 [Cucumis melo var. makuwa]